LFCKTLVSNLAVIAIVDQKRPVYSYDENAGCGSYKSSSNSGVSD
jgi:hypothetical protein